MYKNDYRRALIMMRPVLSRGMSGHVRLERRTLMGTMRFTVSGADPSETLHALLMADTGQSWVVYRLGTLNMDGRGQSGLAVTFDPRSLSGLDLDAYTLVVLVRTGAGAPELSMTGFINGSREVNWAQAHEAACTLYEPGSRVTHPTQAAEPEEEAVEVVAQLSPNATRSEPTDPYGAPYVDPMYDDETLYEAMQEDESPLGKYPLDEDGYPPCDCEFEDAQAVFEPVPYAAPAPAPAPQPAQIVPELTVAPVAPSPPVQTAAEALELDENAIWPDEIASLRVLFFVSQPTTAFTLEGFVFVEAPLPNEDGTQGLCAIGLRAENGQPVSVCYALPGEFSMEPPPGLEGYEYAGGWWFTVLESLEPDPA